MEEILIRGFLLLIVSICLRLKIMQFGNDLLSTILYMVFIGVIFVQMLFGQRIQMWGWIKQIEGALRKLEIMALSGREITVNTVKEVGKSPKDPASRVSEFLEFFTIEPVAKDPAGVLKRLEHLIDVRKNQFEDLVLRIAPEANVAESLNLENLIEAVIAVNYIFRVVRHFLLLGKKQKSLLMIMQIQMQLPEIMRIANAYFNALKAFAVGKPIGDGIGALVVASIVDENRKSAGFEEIPDVAKNTGAYKTDFEGRTLFLIKATGPGGSVGKPGEAIKIITEQQKGKIARIITIDAALKLEGDKTGELVEGVGAAIGGFGVEKFKMEDTGLSHKIPLDALIIKEAIEDALTPMKKEIAESVEKVIERVKRIIRERTKPDDVLIIAGIGNTMGVGF